MDTEIESNRNEATGDISPSCSNYSGIVHTKKVIKHALRQQVKRRRKNTTIASGNSRSLPRIVVKPLPLPATAPTPVPVDEILSNMQHNVTVEEPVATMREVLASLPGFCLKSSRRRSTKRLSAAAQLEAGLVDLESPASILSSTSLRALLNRHTFQGLPPLYQRKLAQLLPSVDRQDAATSGLNNEFFARACLEWRKRLAEGEFTPENQQKLKMEAEKDKNKLDPWKLKHFEPIWGDKREPRLRYGVHRMNEPGTGGAVTRSSFRLRLETNNQDTQTIKSLYCRPVIIMSSDNTKMIDCSKKNSVITVLSSDNLSPNKIAEDRIEATSIKTSEKYESDDKILQNEMNHISLKLITNGNFNPDSKSGFESELINKLSDSPTQSISSVEVSIPMKMKNFKVSEIHQTNEKPDEGHEANLSNPITERIEAEKSNTIDVSPLLEETIINLATSPITRIESIISDIDEQRSDEYFSNTKKIKYVHQNHEENLNGEIQCPSHDTSDSITELTMSLSQVSEIHLSHDGVENNCEQQFDSLQDDEKIFKLSTCKNITVVEDLSLENDVINTPIDAEVINTDASNTEPVPEAMEIDSETLRRIHELEVRGEMREAYEEISGCTEEVIYPLLESMEMGSNGSNETPDQTQEIREINITENNEEEELRDANNYVCSEMLECSWPVESTINNTTSINNISTHEDLQVTWPLVAAALDGSVAANITVTTQEDCNDSSTLTDLATSTSQVPSAQLQQRQQQHHQQQQLPPSLIQQPENDQFISGIPTIEPVNCKSLPFQETILMDTTTTSCLVTNIQSQSPPIISFSPLPAVRFVPRFHQNSCHPTAISTKQPAQQKPIHQDIVQLTNQSTSKVINNTRNNSTAQHVQGVIQSAIIQHPTPIPVTQSRQIITHIQHPQYTSSSVRSARSSGQGSSRSSRSGNKDQSSGRSKSSMKEPPGAVNLERSYQICQAVIQSSPNRDQLKAHLKPPPSLLARGDAVFTSSKSGGRTITTVKSQKQQSAMQHGCKQHNKTPAVMLRPMLAPTRQGPVLEAIENSSTMTHLGTNSINNFGQYILVQRTGVSDGAPRASSAPPLPPQIAGIGVGVHLVRGRPASAGEGSHQAVTLKAKAMSDGRGGGAEPGAPGVIIGGDPPPPCECSMRSAMAICRQCGAFCHDDCIGPQRICATCLIR